MSPSPNHRHATWRGAPISRLVPHRALTFLSLRVNAQEHELATHRGLAERLARLLDCRFEPDGNADAMGEEIGYAVPNDTIVGIEFARRLGIRSEGDLFGGVVPLPFVATKVITHPLVAVDAAAPDGWNPAFPERVRDVALPGHCAFSLADARVAAKKLLRDGPVRIKLGEGIGGLGQWTAADVAQFDAQISKADEHRLASCGVVVESNVDVVRTCSVGTIRVGALVASYVGEQRTTRNARGHEVYGGSTILVARGDLDALDPLTRGDVDRSRAVAFARVYHEAALDCFAGMFASRCNYDVVQGHDASGRLVTGVLEQSWRIGGATGAEVAALQALVADPSLHVVRASTVEDYSEDAVVPEGATLYFSGIDPQVGRITKYAQLHHDDHT